MAKYSHCMGKMTYSAQHIALMVTKPREGGQSTRINPLRSFLDNAFFKKEFTSEFIHQLDTETGQIYPSTNRIQIGHRRLLVRILCVTLAYNDIIASRFSSGQPRQRWTCSPGVKI